jgi:transposase
MKSNSKMGAGGRRERRVFSAEFKAEAVRLVADRRAVGATLAQIGRELDVRPDQLRAWTRKQQGSIRERASGTGPTAMPGETLEQENRRLRREVAVLRRSKRSQKKWRCTSRRSRIEVRRDYSPSVRVRGATDVSGVGSISIGLLRLTQASAELARVGGRDTDGARACHSRRERRNLRRTTCSPRVTGRGTACEPEACCAAHARGGAGRSTVEAASRLDDEFQPRGSERIRSRPTCWRASSMLTELVSIAFG